MKPLLVADLFCGAGGSSTGAQRAIAALGREMELVAVNHWDRAIETHSRMHPLARHHCQDVSSARPLQLVPEGRLDLLMASPTCTYHSRARGGRPTSDQQRMDPWHVVTWLTELRVKRLIIENVPEFVDWGPVDGRNGKPLRSRKGEYFRQWIETLERLGFRVEWKILNAADYGDATTRQRFFLLARADRKPIVWPAPTHSRDGRADLFGDGARRWRAAREIIDWSHKGRSIFTRKKPLSAKTILRIHAGAVRFKWPAPFIVILREHATARGIDLPSTTITAGGGHSGLVEPILLPQHGGQAPTRDVAQPLPTLVTVARVGLVEPFTFPVNQGGDRMRGHRSVDRPMPTITATGHDLGLVEPFILSQAAGGAPRPSVEPVPTIVGGGAHALVSAFYGNNHGCKSVGDPLDTVTTKDRFGLVVPVTHANGHARARGVDDPLVTLTTAKRGELALITGAFGEREGQAPRVRGVDEPTPTILAQGHVPMVEPVVDGDRYDILFRMLEPRELAAAMGFSDDDYSYEFAGNKTEITKQIGNAVPVRTARALVAAQLSDLAVAGPMKIAAE